MTYRAQLRIKLVIEVSLQIRIELDFEVYSKIGNLLVVGGFP